MLPRGQLYLLVRQGCVMEVEFDRKSLSDPADFNAEMFTWVECARKASLQGNRGLVADLRSAYMALKDECINAGLANSWIIGACQFNIRDAQYLVYSDDWRGAVDTVEQVWAICDANDERRQALGLRDRRLIPLRLWCMKVKGDLIWMHGDCGGFDLDLMNTLLMDWRTSPHERLNDKLAYNATCCVLKAWLNKGITYEEWAGVAQSFAALTGITYPVSVDRTVRAIGRPHYLEVQYALARFHNLSAGRLDDIYCAWLDALLVDSQEPYRNELRRRMDYMHRLILSKHDVRMRWSVG